MSQYGNYTPDKEKLKSSVENITDKILSRREHLEIHWAVAMICGGSFGMIAENKSCKFIIKPKYSLC
jgi:hypothetical protein